jgi:hypothetical protein
MKRFIATAIAGLAVASTAHAATAVNNNFTVSTTLTSQCTAIASGTLTVDFGPYTAFQVGANTGTNVSLKFQCTRGLPITGVAFDTVDTNSTAAGVGVIPGAGLQYTLTSAVDAANTVAGTAASSATIGTGDIKAYTVGGSMPGNQAGTCGSATCAATQPRILILTF